MILVGLFASMVFSVSSIQEGTQRPLPQNNGNLTLPEKEWVDGTYMLDPDTGTMSSEEASASIESSFTTSSYPPSDMGIVVGDFGLNIDYEQNFRLVLTGTNCYIYVAYDLMAPFYNYYDAPADQYVFVNPNYPTGGWTTDDRISTSQLTYLMNEFDNHIYPVMANTFGYPVERPVGEAKIYILIMNMRDPSYYDSTITWYVAGYFSWGEDSMYDKNMIHIDTYDWANRIGPNVARPYVYESTFAHEFEHLIHNDIDAGEESWVDEGLADLAPYLLGYGHEAGHIANYLVYHPFVSLTFFGGNLENYGASYLFQLYLWEHYGGTPFIVDLVYNPLHGIEGIEDTLHSHGYMISFDELFHNWAIANYIDDLSIGNGEYGYFTLDIPSLDTWGYSIEYALHNYWQGPEFKQDTYMQASWWYGTVQPYTAQYWDFGFAPAGRDIRFLYGGDALSGMLAHSGSYQWYGGMGNWAWRRLGQGFSIPMGGATLKFWTYYEIETDWDYAYVEVHDLLTDTWTTLPGLMTTTTLPHAQDNPNTPAGHEPMDYNLAGTWNALTGFSGTYYEEQMDLSAFAGHEIELYFVYWTDGAYNEQGIYIDDISIPELSFLDDVEAGENGWTNYGWKRTTGLEPNNWAGTVIDVTGVNAYRNPSGRYNMRTGKMENFQPGTLCHVWPIVEGSLKIPNKFVNNGHVFVGIFWNAAPHVLRGDYWFYVYAMRTRSLGRQIVTESSLTMPRWITKQSGNGEFVWAEGV
jgi:hypothetical protein